MNAQKLLILLSASFVCIQAGRAQKQIISVGATTSLTIKTGTTFSMDSLVLIPGADFTLSSNNIQVSPIAVNLVAGPSINRVYYLSSPITFTGTIQLYYQLSELNGNTESALLYTDSAVAVTWLAQSGSTVNTALHFVQYVASARPFIGSTASGPAIILPLSLISFTGKWDRETPVLEWVVEQINESSNFAIESRSDGTNWKTIGEVSGVNGNGQHSYSFTDMDPSADKIYYRIRLIEVSGISTYSYTVKLQKGDNTNNVRLVANGNGIVIRFSGTKPTAIRLINALGMVLRTDRTSRQEYYLTGLIPGAYLLQYEINGQWTVRQFVVY